MKERLIIFTTFFTLAIVGAMGTTLAYYKITHTGESSVFIASKFDTTFNTEYKSSLCELNGKKEEYDFKVKNASDKAFMTRISLDEKWVDNSGNVILSNIIDGQELAIVNFTNASDWKKIGNYYYYKNSIEPGEVTSNLIRGFEVTINYDGTNMCHYDSSNETEVCAQANFTCSDYLFKVLIRVDVIQTDDYEEVWNIDEQTLKGDSTYTVNFVKNSQNATGSMVSGEYVYGTIYNLPKNTYVNEGYDFVEWNTDYKGRGRSFNDEEQIADIGNDDTDIVNLYAIWKKPYDVVFSSSDSTNCPLDSTVYAKIENVRYGSLIKESAIPNPECTGYIFKGWLAEGDIDRNNAKYGIVNTPENLWTAGNKGTYFKNLSSTGGEVELVAEWEEKSYLIHFNGNGVTGGNTDAVECKYSKQCELTKNAFVRTGYTFIGWSTTPKGSATYTDRQTVTKLTLDNEITLYAVWDVDPTFCQKNQSITATSGIVCKRAEVLHSATCNSKTNQGCKNVGTDSSTIIYGGCGVNNSDYTPGDAFDCDVNGDGKFNGATERFYYVSDYYNPNTNTWDKNTAVLVYYTSVKKEGGVLVPDINTGSTYNPVEDNAIGPATGSGYALSYLPTTSEWSNVTLVNTSRQIRNDVGGTTSDNGKKNLGVIDYTGFAARFLTVQELEKACNLTFYDQTPGGLDACTYLLENTVYQNELYLGGIWLETANSRTNSQVGRTLGGSRKTGLSNVKNSGSGYGSSRPVIELPKTKILTKVNEIDETYTVTFNGNGSTFGTMDVLTCDTFDKCKLSKNEYMKNGYAFMGWSTTPNGIVEFENEEEVFSLVTSGNIDLYAVWDDLLYDVVKKGYDKTKVNKYIGVGADSYDNDVYFYSGNSDVNNVIYGGVCWKIIRTTKTGGVKLVYNGEVENGKCFSTRSNKTGIKGLNAEEIDLNGEYLYGTKFEINGTSFRVSGTTNTGTYTSATSSSYQGLYTCLNISGVCDKIYRVGTNSNGTVVFASVYEVGTIGYNEIATSVFNSNYKSVSSVGYMYNTSYNYKDSGNCYYESSGEKRCLDVLSLPDALNTMLRDNNVNVYDSDAKRLIDLWYEENMQDYTSGIEDTIYCNEREPYNTTDKGVLNKSGWNGGTLGQPLYFTTSITAKSFESLYCESELDKFSVSSEVGNAKLTYPVGMISASEYFISNGSSSSSINNSINGLHLISANSVTNNINNNYVNSRGVLSYYGSTGDVRGIRPSISLKPGTEFQTGTGYEFDPYVVVLSNTSKVNLVIDLDGGVSSQNTLISANSGEEITLVEPVKEDYIFLNWTLEKGTPLQFNNNKITLNLENVVVKANWKSIYDNKYTVNFASNDNTNCPLDSNIYANISNIPYGELIKESAIANPECAGYRFTGWTSSGDINLSTARYGNVNIPNLPWQDKNKGTYFKDLSTTDNGVVTLTANFVDASLCPDNANIVVISGAKCKRATTLHKSGDIVYGNCGTLGVLSSGDAFDCDINDDSSFDPDTERFYYVSDLYNLDTKTWDSSTARLIHYKNNGSGEYKSSNTLSSYEVEKGCGITAGSYTVGELDSCRYLTEGNNSYWLSNLSDEYDTNAWTVDAPRRLLNHSLKGNNNGYRTALSIPKNKIMIGNKYTVGDTHTITFSTDGGVLDSYTKTVTNGEIYGTMPIPVKASNVFDGWFLDSNLTIMLDENSVVDLNEDITLYAKYSNTYIIEFDSNGATGTMNNLTCYVDIDCPLTANNFVSSNNNFVGWSTSRNGTKAYDDEEVVRNITIKEHITLYAIWQSSS